MKKYFKAAVGTVALLAAIVTGPAHAIFGVGDIVIDPTNLVQNTYSSIAAVKNEVNTAKSYIAHAQQLISMAKSLQSVQGLSSLAGVQQELAMYQQLKNVSSQLLNAMERSRTLSETVQSQYGASTLDWKSFLTTKSEINRARSLTLSNQYAAVEQNMSDVAQRRQAIVEQLQGSAGQTAAMQSVGAGVDALIGQNQQMVMLLKAQGQDSLIKQINEESDYKAVERDMIERQRKILESANKYK